MSKPKKINCKWCGMGHQPKADGKHWIVKSIIPARIDIRECAYHKAGQASPIAMSDANAAIYHGDIDGDCSLA